MNSRFRGLGGGVYLLFMTFRSAGVIKVGTKNEVHVDEGEHGIYVGSARGGLGARLNRHLREDKKLHWHVDYLLQHAEIFLICHAETGIDDKDKECDLSMAIASTGWGIPVPGVGNSDCSRCQSHFYRYDGPVGKDILESWISDVFRRIKLVPVFTWLGAWQDSGNKRTSNTI